MGGVSGFGMGVVYIVGRFMMGGDGKGCFKRSELWGFGGLTPPNATIHRVLIRSPQRVSNAAFER